MSIRPETLQTGGCDDSSQVASSEGRDGKSLRYRLRRLAANLICRHLAAIPPCARPGGHEQPCAGGRKRLSATVPSAGSKPLIDLRPCPHRRARAGFGKAVRAARLPGLIGDPPQQCSDVVLRLTISALRCAMVHESLAPSKRLLAGRSHGHRAAQHPHGLSQRVNRARRRRRQGTAG